MQGRSFLPMRLLREPRHFFRDRGFVASASAVLKWGMRAVGCRGVGCMSTGNECWMGRVLWPEPRLIAAISLLSSKRRGCRGVTHCVRCEPIPASHPCCRALGGRGVTAHTPQLTSLGLVAGQRMETLLFQKEKPSHAKTPPSFFFFHVCTPLPCEIELFVGAYPLQAAKCSPVIPNS